MKHLFYKGFSLFDMMVVTIITPLMFFHTWVWLVVVVPLVMISVIAERKFGNNTNSGVDKC